MARKTKATPAATAANGIEELIRRADGAEQRALASEFSADHFKRECEAAEARECDYQETIATLRDEARKVAECMTGLTAESDRLRQVIARQERYIRTVEALVTGAVNRAAAEFAAASDAVVEMTRYREWRDREMAALAEKPAQ